MVPSPTDTGVFTALRTFLVSILPAGTDAGRGRPCDRKFSGVYSIMSPSGGIYVGSAVNLVHRWQTHRRHLQQGWHCNPLLQRACDKYGIENLTFKVLLICRPENLLDYEQKAIDGIKPIYNICPTAGSNLGRKFGPQSSEHIAKRAAAHRGMKRSAETCAKISASNKGKIISEEQKSSMSLARRGIPISSEALRKRSASTKGKPRGPMSEETKKKLSLSQNGRPRWSTGDRQRISISLMGNKRSVGRVLTEEHKAKISQAQKGRIQKPVSDETRSKMSASAKSRWKNGGKL